MDSYKYKKSYGKDDRGDYAKCKQINVNINGVEFNIKDLPGILGTDFATAAAAAAEDEGIETSSFGSSGSGSNGPSGYDSDKGFVFICISNNDNRGAGSGGGGGEEPLTCEECFINNLNDIQLQNLENTLEVSGLTLESFCEILSNPVISNEQKSTELVQLFQDAQIPGDSLVPIIDCLEALGVFDFLPRGG